MTMVTVVATLLSVGAEPAQGGIPRKVAPRCDFEGATAEARRLGDLPPAVASALHRASAPRGMAEVGAPFQKTDVRRPLPMRRFLQAQRVRDTWLVWFEQGGLAYRLRFATVTTRPGHRYDAEVASPTRGDPCAAARAWLAGDRTSVLVRGPRPARRVQPIPVFPRPGGSGRTEPP